MELVNLGDICQVIAGQSPPSASYNQNGEGVPFFQGKADFGELYPTVRYWCTEPKKFSEPGDILFSVRAPVGPTNLNNIESCIGRGLAAIRPKDEINTSYLLHFLRANEIQISSKGVGSTFTAITIGDLKSIQIPLHPLSIQKKIAAILDAADVYRQKTKALITKYDQLAQSIFQEMFGDPINNPKGWERNSLGNVVNNLDSQRVPIKLADREEMDGEYPYYGASGIIDHVNDYIFEGRNLLIGEDGANLLARSTPIAFLAQGKYWVNNHAHVLSDNGQANLCYLEYFINAISLEPYISGSAQPKLNRKNMDTIPISIPNRSIQDEFEETIDQIKIQKEILDRELLKSEELFSSLLQRAFRKGLN